MVRLSNAEKQRRYRQRQAERFEEAIRAAEEGPLQGSPQLIADAIFRELGVKKARKVVRILDKRLRAIKRKCSYCKGTGTVRSDETTSACGSVKYTPLSIPCTCDEKMDEFLNAEGKIVFRVLG